jgi:glycosyltransferase involved in cell wall biosynthesis
VGVAHLDAFWFMWPRRLRFSDRLVSLLNDGTVELVQLDSIATTDLLVIRYPPVLQFASRVASTISARRVVVVANQPPYDRDGSGRRYDIDTVMETVHAMFGTWPEWAPQGPLVRELLELLVDSSRLLPVDVPAILDAQSWLAAREPRQGRRPVVGRYSRDIDSKWPEVRNELLAAYASERFDTRLMGGPVTLTRVVGEPARWPHNWTVSEEGEIDARAFLRDIDFFVYFHASSYREAFGRSIVEAMASGAVVILPATFAPVFGDAAVYCAPDQVESVVLRMFADDHEYESQQARGWEFVSTSCSYESYVALVRALIARAVPSRS